MDVVALSLVIVLQTGAVAGLASGGSRSAEAPLTLDAALAMAKQRALIVAAARERAAGAREAAALVPRWLNPSLELRAENWGSGLDLPIDGFVVLTQPLELFGSRAARFGVAGAEHLEAEAATRTIERDVVHRVAGRYLEAVRLREAIGFVGDQRDGLRQIVTALERRLTEGVAAEADLRKFEAELAHAETEALRLDLDRVRVLHELAAWLSLPALTGDELVRPPLPPVLVGPADAGLTEALERRPDIAAARARLARAERTGALARARARPDLFVSGGYKRTAESNAGVVALSFPVPLADRNGAAIARAAAEVRAVTAELDDVRAFARAEAYAAVMRAQALAAGAERAMTTLVAPALVVQRAARAAFREGAFDALRLVDAERVVTEARRSQLALHLDAVLASLEARLALGEELVP